MTSRREPKSRHQVCRRRPHPGPDPATTGLRNLSGIVNADGTVSLFAITGLVSATVPPGSEAFTTIAAPTYAIAYRGVSQIPLAATTAVL